MINKDFFKMAEEDAKERGFAVEEVLACMEKALIGAFKKEHGNTSCKVEFKPKKNKKRFNLFIRLSKTNRLKQKKIPVRVKMKMP